MGTVAELAASIRVDLAAAADPSLAPGQQAYMKTTEPYLGVRVPAVRALVGAVVKAAPDLTRAQWESLVRTLFDGATHREHRYAAQAVLRHRRFAAYRDHGCLPLVRHLVVEGAWWDIVDDTSQALGDALLADRAAVTPVVRAWADDDDMWVRRSAVLSQLTHRDATDRELLARCLDAQLGRPEFWLRKACGWALRDLSYVDPEWVVSYLTTRGDTVSPLTRREGMKVIDRRAASAR